LARAELQREPDRTDRLVAAVVRRSIRGAALECADGQRPQSQERPETDHPSLKLSHVDLQKIEQVRQANLAGGTYRTVHMARAKLPQRFRTPNSSGDTESKPKRRADAAF